MSQKTMTGTPDMLEAPVHGGLRRAALYLHALHRSDRTYLLNQLSENEKSILDTLLMELSALGIPADGEWANITVVACDEAIHLPSAHGEQAHDQLVARLTTAAPKAIGHVLLAEPNRLVAQVLACQPWPWKAAVLEQAGPSRRRIIGEYLHARPRPSSARLQRAVLMGLHERVVSCSVDTPDSTTIRQGLRTSMFNGLMRRLQGNIAMRQDKP